MIDYYAILGVSRKATTPEIRDAYLKLARTSHPDTVRDPAERKKAEDAFKFVTAAYDTLSRDRARKDYTAKLPPESNEPVETGRRTGPPVVQGPALSPRETGAATGQAGPGGSAIASNARVQFDSLTQGIEAFKKEDFHTAVQYLTAAVNQDETNPKAHGMLARALAKNPNWIRDAMNHMETASKLDPKNVSYLAEYALLLQSQGLKLRAKRALETAMGINAEHPDVIRALKEIPIAPAEPEAPAKSTGETSRGLFDRLRKR